MTTAIQLRGGRLVLDLEAARARAAKRPKTTSGERREKTYQKRLILGLCRQCAKPRNRYRHRCDECQTAERIAERARKRTGSQRQK